MKSSMKKTVLHDLIRINNDRIEGYEKAMKQIGKTDPDLVSLFSTYIKSSEKNRQELLQAADTIDPDVVTDTTIPGDVYRLWMDMKVMFGGDSRAKVLASCEFGEDAAQKAYKNAIEEYQDLPEDVTQLIMAQKAILNKEHNHVKQLRDLEKIAD